MDANNNGHFLRQKGFKEFVDAFSTPEVRENRHSSELIGRLQKILKNVESMYFADKLSPDHIRDACDLLNTMLNWNFDNVVDLFELRNKESLYSHFDAYFSIFPSVDYSFIHLELLKVLSRLFLVWILHGNFEFAAPLAFLKKLTYFNQQILSLSTNFSTIQPNSSLILQFSFYSMPNHSENTLRSFIFSSCAECQSLSLFISQLICSISTSLHQSSLPLTHVLHLDSCLYDLSSSLLSLSSLSQEAFPLLLSILDKFKYQPIQARYRLVSSLFSHVTSPSLSSLLSSVYAIACDDIINHSHAYVIEQLVQPVKNLAFHIIDDCSNYSSESLLNFGLFVFCIGIELNDEMLVSKMMMIRELWFGISLTQAHHHSIIRRIVATSRGIDLPSTSTSSLFVIVSLFIGKILSSGSVNESLGQVLSAISDRLSLLTSVEMDQLRLDVKQEMMIVHRYYLAIDDDNDDKMMKKKSRIESSSAGFHFLLSDNDDAVDHREELFQLKGIITSSLWLWTSDDDVVMKGPACLRLMIGILAHDDHDVDVDDDDLIPLALYKSSSSSDKLLYRLTNVISTAKQSSCRHLIIKSLSVGLNPSSSSDIDMIRLSLLHISPGLSSSLSVYFDLLKSSSQSSSWPLLSRLSLVALNQPNCMCSSCYWFAIICACFCRHNHHDDPSLPSLSFDRITFPLTALLNYDDDYDDDLCLHVSEMFNRHVISVMAYQSSINWSLLNATITTSSSSSSSSSCAGSNYGLSWIDIDERAELQILANMSTASESISVSLLDVVSSGDVLAEMKCVESHHILGFIAAHGGLGSGGCCEMKQGDEDNRISRFLQVFIGKLLLFVNGKIINGASTVVTRRRMIRVLSSFVGDISPNRLELLALICLSFRLLLSLLSHNDDDDVRTEVMKSLKAISRERFDQIFKLCPSLSYFIFVKCVSLKSTIRRDVLSTLTSSSSITELMSGNLTYISYALFGNSGSAIIHQLAKCNDVDFSDSNNRFSFSRACLENIHSTVRQFLLAKCRTQSVVDFAELNGEFKRIKNLSAEYGCLLVQVESELSEKVQWKVIFDLLRGTILQTDPYTSVHWKSLQSLCLSLSLPSGQQQQVVQQQQDEEVVVRKKKRGTSSSQSLTQHPPSSSSQAAAVVASTSSQALSDSIRNWLHKNFHRSIHYLVQSGWKTMNPLEKSKNMTCLLFLISVIHEEELRQSFPKILSCIHMGLSDGSALVRLASIWSLKQAVRSASKDTLLVHFSTIVSCLISVMSIDNDCDVSDDIESVNTNGKRSLSLSPKSSFALVESQVSCQLKNQLISCCGSMLTYLLSDRCVDFRDSFHLVPLAPILEGYSSSLNPLSDIQNKSPISSVLRSMIGLLGHELSIVRKMVLNQMCQVLSNRRSELTAIVSMFSGIDIGSSEASVVSDVIASCVQISSCEQSKDVKNLCGQVLGEVGAIDPGRVKSCLSDARWKIPSSMLPCPTIGSRDSENLSSPIKRWEFDLFDFSLFLMEKFLVPSLLSRNLSLAGFCEQDKSALSIQSLLRKMLKYSVKPKPDGKKTTITTKNDESVDELPQHLADKLKERKIYEFVAPYWSTKYLNTEAFQKSPPFFVDCRTMSDWIASWCRYLLKHGNGVVADLCECCSTLVKKNVDLCRFLIPYLLVDTQWLDDDHAEPIFNVGLLFNAEISLVLQALNAVGKPSMDRENLIASTQFIFTTLDCLYEWMQQLSAPVRKHYRNVADEITKRDNEGQSIDFRAADAPFSPPQYYRICELMNCVSKEDLSNAAHKIGAHARELRYLETWMRESCPLAMMHHANMSSNNYHMSSSSTNSSVLPQAASSYAEEMLCSNRNDGSGNSLPTMKPAELDRLMMLYQNLSDSDGIRGVQAVRRLQHASTTVYHRIIESEHENDWLGTLEAYEEALSSFPVNATKMTIDSSCSSDANQQLDIRSKFNSSELSAGMFRNLAELGHFESLLNQASGKLGLEDASRSVAYPYAVQAAWQLQNWDLLTTLMDKNPTLGVELLDISDQANYDRKLQVWTGSLLCILRSGDRNQFDKVISSARCEILSSMESRMESYRRVYPQMLQLHILREIEQCMNLSSSSPAQVTLQELTKFDWNGRLSCMVSTPNSLLSVLSVRKAVMHLLHYSGNCSSDWLKLGKLGNETGNYSLARYGLRQAKSAGAMQDELDILESKILQSENYVSRAVRLLEPSDIDVSNVRIEIKRINGQDLKSSRGPKFADAVQSLVRNTPKKEFFARKLLLSTIWMSESSQRHGRNIIERFKLVMEMCNDWEKGYYFFAKYVQYLADARKPADDKLVDDSYIQYMSATIEHYCKCLQCGFKYLYSTLPRLLTLYFDFLTIGEGSVSAAQSGELANLKKQQRNCTQYIQSLLTNAPSSMWFVCLPQIVSRLNHPSEQVREMIVSILSSVMKDHASQAIWHLAAVIGSGNPVRQQASLRILSAGKRFVDVALESVKYSLGDDAPSGLSNDRQRNSRVDKRLTASQETMLRTQKERLSGESRMLSQATRLFSELVRLAEQTDRTGTSKHNIGSGIDLHYFLVPSLSAMTVRFPSDTMNSFKSNFSLDNRIIPQTPTSSDVIIIDKSSPNVCRAKEILSNWNPFPIGQERFVRFLPEYEIMHSKAKPKKLSAITSSGSQVRFLVKQEKNGDLRKDARLMEFSGMINLLLHQDSEARQRKLGMKTYSVICLNEECGIIEWMDGTHIYRQLVAEASSHYEFFRRCPPYKTFRGLVDELQLRHETNIADLVNAYKTNICSQYPPCFHRWFLETYNDPTEWIEARCVFSRSSAVWASFGHIVGLGDRHGENILIDIRTAECVHVDFDCLFDKGLVLNKPEIVPFRLTPNIVDALGLTGYEGAFRRVMEVTMDVLRKNKVTILSAIEPFVRDPTVQWTRVGKVQQKSGMPLNNRQKNMEEENENSSQILQKVRGRLDGNYNISHPHHEKILKAYKARGDTLPLDSGLLNSSQENFALSVEGQVQRLIQEATSVPNLAQMFVGWMPWM